MKKALIFIIVLAITIYGLIYVLKNNNDQSVKVLSPKTGDVVVIGSIQKIEWETKNIPESYKISVSIRRIPPPPLQEEGQEFDPIIFINLPNTGSHEWTVSNMYPEGNYILDITSYASIPITNPISGESEQFIIKKANVIGGDRDSEGCLISAGYAFSKDVGACIRAFDMTPDIMKAAKMAVNYIGRSYALTVVSFNSYEEFGSYDIMFERGEERVKQTVYIKNNKVQSVSASLECHDSPKYFVIEKSLTDSVGSDILIKYKTNLNQIMPCVYKVENEDFELKNVSAEYFLAFTDNFLLLDSGTAPPPRELIVYDLNSRKKVFTDLYRGPVTQIGDNITYLSVTSEKVTTKNCPSLSEYTADGLGAVIMSKITVNLSTLTKKDLGQKECFSTQ
ncbi:MAG: hypothetical protein CEO12_150 [Parcubacteria group bacterium Gr01-1014_46]|nr:MAG: hypothetical protein CEO12_150 [Parcubacteria group bacterium Gr01-1014_46]